MRREAVELTDCEYSIFRSVKRIIERWQLISEDAILFQRCYAIDKIRRLESVVLSK